MEDQMLIDAALSCGAAKATLLDQQQIVLSDTFRAICESNQCGGYGKCWMCPPYIGEIHQLMDTVRSFPRGLWFQTISDIEDSYDIEGMFEAGARHARVSGRIREKFAPLLKKPFLCSAAAAATFVKPAPNGKTSPAGFRIRPFPPWKATAWTCTIPPRIQTSSTSMGKTR